MQLSGTGQNSEKNLSDASPSNIVISFRSYAATIDDCLPVDYNGTINNNSTNICGGNTTIVHKNAHHNSLYSIPGKYPIIVNIASADNYFALAFAHIYNDKYIYTLRNLRI